MARRVFVHIGTMKSATSYVQQLLDVNQARVVEQGLLWTESPEYFLATDDLLGTRRTRPGLEGAWARLAEQLAGHDGDALISNELLAVANVRKRVRLVTALEPAEVRIVVTARDLGRVVPSQWQTGARNRDVTTWNEYVAAICDDGGSDVASGFWRRQQLAQIVDRWSGQVPVANITVVTVPPAGTKPEVFAERFASVVGLDVSSFAPPVEENASVGGYSAELLRRLNERTAELDWLHYRWAFKNGLARAVLAERADQEPPIMLTRDQLEQVSRRAHAMVEELARSGVEVVGSLDDLIPAADDPGDVVDPGDSNADDLLEAAIAGLLGLGGLLAAARIEHEALVTDVDELFPEAAGDWEAFVASESGEPERSQTLVPSRYLRWRLQRRVERGGPGLEE
jgi:hypothetical protein